MHAYRKLLLIILLGAGALAQASPRDLPGQFDYYAVALSWSPSYCATHRDPVQCSRGLGFVLHGLWPQHEAGYPQSCSRERLPESARNNYASLFPSPKLVGHEWDKHGTCSGLAPEAYFALSAKLKAQVVIPPAYQRPATPLRTSPDQFVQAFRAANPGMMANSVLPFCDAGGRFLREVHACFAKDGRYRSCSEGQVRRSYSSCRQESFLLQSVR